MAAEAEPGIGTDGTQPLFEGVGGMHLHRSIVCFCDGNTALPEDLRVGCRAGHQSHQHLLGAEFGRQATAAGIEILGLQEACQQHLPQPGQALGPEQGNVVVGVAILAAGLGAFGLQRGFWNHIQLWVQTLTVVIHG